jgi:predicted transcriptional regulator
MIETLTFQIEKELKQELKIIALKQDRTVKEILNEIIQDFVNENK